MDSGQKQFDALPEVVVEDDGQELTTGRRIRFVAGDSESSSRRGYNADGDEDAGGDSSDNQVERRNSNMLTSLPPGVSSFAHHPHPSFLVQAGHQVDPAEPVPPHPLFTEMMEISGDDNRPGGIRRDVWLETARWVKFEEIVEEGSRRWSKPHIATPSLISLLQLSACILDGSCLLNLNVSRFHEIVDSVLHDFCDNRVLSRDQVKKLRQLLLRPKVHQYDQLAKHASGVDEEDRKPGDVKVTFDTQESVAAVPKRRKKPKRFTMPENRNPGFFKKLPQHCEAVNVLVGESPALQFHIAAFVRLLHPLVIPELTEVPVPTRLLFILIGPCGHSGHYHEIGRAFATLMSDETFASVPYTCGTKEELIAGMDEFLDQTTVLPPSSWNPEIRIQPHAASAHRTFDDQRSVDDDESAIVYEDQVKHEIGHANDPTLRRTGRLFGGLMADIKRKAPHYVSDFKDGLAMQSLSSFFFMFFVNMAPVVTFGGLLSESTAGEMGAMESVLAACVCGVTYHLFAGQPLTILGATGPLLVFEQLVYNISLGISFLPFRFWINVWICVILLVVVAVDGSTIIKYVTRFTEESFATLISIIFILSSFNKLVEVYQSYQMVTLLPQGHLPASPADGNCSCIGDPTENDYAWLKDIQAQHQWPDSYIQNRSWYVPMDTGNFTLDYDKVPLNMCHELHGHTVGDGCYLSQKCSCVGDPYENSFEWLKALQVQHHWPDSYIHNRSWYIPSSNGSFTIDYSQVPLKMCHELHGHTVGRGCYLSHNVFFMSLVLTIGTLVFSFAFKNVKNTFYFPSAIRSLISNFAVSWAILLMVITDLVAGLDTPKLDVPNPTNPGRPSFLVDPMDNPWWTIIFAVLPALLCSILIFMDQQITSVIVNRAENKLKKGCGYHLDLFVLSFQVLIVGALGLPVYVAATVRSMNHVNSLKIESEARVPGEIPSFIGCREQRLTGAVTFLAIGLSVFITPVLQVGLSLVLIPMPVLYGVFLYMGISALDGIQLVDRFLLCFMPMKYQPDYVYLRHVSVGRVHFFTFVQILCLGMLWAVKSVKTIAIAFPLMLIVMVVVRSLLQFVFTRSELEHLDDELPEMFVRRKEDKLKKDRIHRDVSAADVALASRASQFTIMSPTLDTIHEGTALEDGGLRAIHSAANLHGAPRKPSSFVTLDNPQPTANSLPNGSSAKVESEAGSDGLDAGDRKLTINTMMGTPSPSAYSQQSKLPWQPKKSPNPNSPPSDREGDQNNLIDRLKASHNKKQNNKTD